MLGDVIELKRGYDLPTTDRHPGTIPIVSSSGPSGWHDKAMAKAPGVVTGRYGTIGQVFFIEQDYWPLNTTLYVSDFKGNDERFVAYFLRSLDFQSFNDKSSVPGLNRNDLHRAPVLFPPLVEQKAIAAVLGSLDDKIEQNRRTGAKLEELARAVFKAWFVDFEPVKAKAAGATAFPGMPPKTFADLPTCLIESPIGTVPQGWEVAKLGKCCEINKHSVRVGQIDSEIEYIDIASVTVGRLDGVQRVQFAEAPSRARRRVRHGDTIWSCVRPNRRSYLFVHSPPENRIVSTGFAVLSPATFGPSYLHELTTRQEFVDYLVANADGSAYPAVRPEHFAAAVVLIPTTVVRDTFEELTMPLRNLMAASEAESFKLAALRDYLLPRLLSGRVRVRDADSILRESA